MILCNLSYAAGPNLKITWTFPGDNSGTCAARILIPDLSLRVVHLKGNKSDNSFFFEDSVSGYMGAQGQLLKVVPAGDYAIRAWASDKGGKGCDTLLIKVVPDSLPPAVVPNMQ